jgi:glycosyltransferase involved in cell wall biosynthesis
MLNGKHSYTLIIGAPSTGNDEVYMQSLLLHLNQYKLNYRFLFDVQPIREVYQLSDYIISHSKIEVFPLTLLEAAACGVPYFAVKNGQTEYILGTIDPQLILQNNTNPFHMDSIRTQKIKDNLSIFSAQYDISIIAKQFVSLLK